MEKQFPTIDKVKTGKQIRHLMDSLGLTVMDVQKYMGLATQQAVYHWLNGRSLPSIDSIDVYTSAGYMLRIDCWEAEKNLKTTYGSECALTSLAVDEPLEYARLYLDGNLQMWVDAEDSLELY